MSFIAMPTVPDQVFGAGMELVPLPAEYMSLPFVPSAHGPSMVVPPSSIPARSALKTTSLSRMEELSSMLTQLNDPSYTQCYVKALNNCPYGTLKEFSIQLRARATYLAYEENREYKRGKSLRIFPAMPVMAPATDIDAFCNTILQQQLPAAAPVVAGERTPKLVPLTGGDVAAYGTIQPTSNKRKRRDSAEAGSEQENAAPPALASHQTLLGYTPPVEPRATTAADQEPAALEGGCPAAGVVSQSMTAAIKKRNKKM